MTRSVIETRTSPTRIGHAQPSGWISQSVLLQIRLEDGSPESALNNRYNTKITYLYFFMIK